MPEASFQRRTEKERKGYYENIIDINNIVVVIGAVEKSVSGFFADISAFPRPHSSVDFVFKS